MKAKVYILALLALAMASFLLVNFGLIWAYGRFYIFESNPLVLILETTLIVAILVFSFYCLLEQIHLFRNPSKNPSAEVSMHGRSFHGNQS
jgi:hypothetical protein